MRALTGILLAATLCLTLAAPGLAVEEQRMPGGFGRVSWGQDVSQRPGFMKLRSQDGIDYFVNLRERYEMPGVGKPTVFYGQAGGRLYAVHVRLGEPKAYDTVLGQMRKLYGAGKQSKEGGAGVVRWKAGPVRIKLKRDEGGQAKLSFYYQPVALLLQAGVREADPDDAELARLMPQGETPVTVPPGALPAKEEPYVGIDLTKYLKEGGELLKLEKPRRQGGQQ